MDRSLSALAPHVADAVVWHDGKSFHPGGFHSFSGIVGKNHVLVAGKDTCLDFTIMAMALEPWRWLIGGLLVVRRQGLEFAMRAFMPWRSCENRDGLRNKDRVSKDIVQYLARPRLLCPESDFQGDGTRTMLIQKTCFAEVAP